MGWFPLAVLATVMITAINYLDKAIVSRHVPDSRAVLIFFALINLVFGMGLLLIVGWPILPAGLALPLMGTGALIMLGNVFYLLARNATYLDYKHFRQPRRTFFLFWGYIARGIANRVPLQGLRGSLDALKMIRNLTPEKRPLSDAARQYIWQHDGRYRGKLLQRARRDIFRRPAPATQSQQG